MSLATRYLTKVSADDDLPSRQEVTDSFQPLARPPNHNQLDLARFRLRATNLKL
jgi:hypothetical protein